MTIPTGLQSRKFWVAVISAVVVFLNAAYDWGLKQDEVMQMLAPILLWITAEGVADIKKR